MADLPVEFMEEDELLAEFHRAGIFTDDERAEMERAAQVHRAYREQQNSLMYALAEAQHHRQYGLADALAQQAGQLHDRFGDQLRRQAQGATSGGLLGPAFSGGLGALFGGFTNSTGPR